MGYITVIGAANIDIGGRPYRRLVPKDSNPGQVRSAPGGVGRNIAHNLRLLGNRVRLISAFGNDAYALQIREDLKKLGVDTDESLVCKGDPTSVYLFITQEDGDMALAVNDMDILSRLTPDFIRRKKEVLSESSLVVLDANLPEETIGAVCSESGCPVVAESVSCAKAGKLKPFLPMLYTVAANRMEAEILSGRSIDPDDPDSLRAASDRLLCEGVKKVVITLSAGGAYFADRDTAGRLFPFPADMVNSNGAGDALTAGLVTGYAEHMSFEDAMKLGMAAACITLETAGTNNPALSLEYALERIKGQKQKEGETNEL